MVRDLFGSAVTARPASLASEKRVRMGRPLGPMVESGRHPLVGVDGDVAGDDARRNVRVGQDDADELDVGVRVLAKIGDGRPIVGRGLR
ncbi:hypothetical protein [Cellulomonas sp. URHB0016]